MVNIITAKISVFIHIPCGVVIVGIKAVADVSAFNFLISHTSSVPQSEIGNNKNRLRKLDIQIYALIKKIFGVAIAHDLIKLIIRITGIEFF